MSLQAPREERDAMVYPKGGYSEERKAGKDRIVLKERERKSGQYRNGPAGVFHKALTVNRERWMKKNVPVSRQSEKRALRAKKIKY